MAAFSTALSHLICATEPINSSENGADQNMSIQHATVDDHTANVHTDMVSTNTQIMSFSDATRLVSVTPQIDVIPPLSADPYVKETLVDFLSRVYSHQVVWQTSYPHGYLLADMRFPDFLFSRQQIWNKLQNFKFFRAGVKIGIRINGTRFNYGSLLAMWEPMSYNTGSLVFATHNVYAASGYPCFTMNPTENEVFEFIMPYALPYPYIDIERFTDGVSYNWWEQGSLSIYVLNPLNPSGPVDVTIYASFVDVDVAGYTSLTNMALPPFFFADQNTFPALLPQPFAFAALEKKDDKLEAQGKSSVNRSSEAQKKSERGVIGGVFETVSRVAGALTVVPEIGVVASAASMVAKGISVVADLFGWSKPPSLLATTPAAIQWSNISNTHGLSDCRVLSVDPANCVHAPSSIAGGRDDEMTIGYIVSTPTLVHANVVWGSFQGLGATLTSIPTGPLTTGFDPATNYQFNTHLSWTSSAFLYWRGSLRYHISIVSSAMHAGRLRITWAPGQTSYPPADIASLESMVGLVVDISKDTEVTFTVPFLYDQPWAPVHFTTGKVAITVVNGLRYPTDPVPSVYLNVWVSAGPDFQLARPQTLSLRQNIIANASFFDPAAAPGSIPEEEVLQAQGVTREEIRTRPAPPLIPGKGAVEEGLVHGEVVTHLKELLMRPGILSQVASASPGTVETTIISPFLSDQVNTNPITGAQAPSFFQYFRNIFRYSRGSFHVWASPTPTSTNMFTQAAITNYQSFAMDGTIIQNTISNPGGVQAIDSVFTPTPCDGTMFSPNTNFPAAATIPFYSTNYAWPNSTLANPAGPGFSYPYLRGSAPQAVIRTGPGTWYTHMACGDDFNFLFLVGPPTTISQNFNAGAAPY